MLLRPQPNVCRVNTATLLPLYPKLTPAGSVALSPKLAPLGSIACSKLTPLGGREYPKLTPAGSVILSSKLTPLGSRITGASSGY